MNKCMLIYSTHTSIQCRSSTANTAGIRISRQPHSGGWLFTQSCLSVGVISFLVSKVSQKPIYGCLQNYSGHSLHTALEMSNFRCSSHSRWLTVSHFSFNHRFIYSIAGCVTGQSGNSESCHSHGVIIGVKAVYIFE